MWPYGSAQTCSFWTTDRHTDMTNSITFMHTTSVGSSSVWSNMERSRFVLVNNEFFLSIPSAQPQELLTFKYILEIYHLHRSIWGYFLTSKQHNRNSLMYDYLLSRYNIEKHVTLIMIQLVICDNYRFPKGKVTSCGQKCNFLTDKFQQNL